MAKTHYIDKALVKRFSTRSDAMGAWMVFHVWAIIIGAGAVAVMWPNMLTIPLAILIIGSRQHGMSVLVHEAAHGILFNNRKVNDFVGQYILGAPYGGDMKSYRHYHLKHHRYAQTEKDPDLALSSKFPVTQGSLMRKLFRDITGQTYLRIRLARFSRDKTKHIEGSDAFVNKSSWLTVLINMMMFAALANWGYWWAYFVLWALPLVTWFFAVIRIRNIAEHGMTTFDNNPLTHARTTEANLIERIFLAPYYVNYHVEHHAYMYVPCYNFPALHRAMKAAGHGEEMETKSSYGKVLKLAVTA